jgi:hypothetical protein
VEGRETLAHLNACVEARSTSCSPV